MSRLTSFVAVAAVLLALVAAVGSRAAEQNPDMPPDIQTLVSGPLPAGNYIAEAVAMAAAKEAHPFIPGTATARAFLVQATEPGTIRAKDPIKDRPVWLIRYSGFAVDGPAPLRADGEPARGEELNLAFVFIDAENGQWLGTRLEGDSAATPDT